MHEHQLFFFFFSFFSLFALFKKKILGINLPKAQTAPKPCPNPSFEEVALYHCS